MSYLKKTISVVSAMALAVPLGSGIPYSHAEEGSAVIINEICTQNKSCFYDSNGSASDWIELLNTGDSPVDIGGYGISDDVSSPLRFVFPSGTVLESGEHLVIVADKGEGSEIRTGFSLSKSGETLTLSTADGSVYQTVEVPSLAEDTSFGCSPDGSGLFTVMTPTPSAPNMQSASVPVFSLPSGFYSVNDNISLSISSSDEIYYTLDGSDPTTSDSAKLYTGEIRMYDKSTDENVYSRYQHEDNSPYSITLQQRYTAGEKKYDKAMIVRAVSKGEDGKYSPIVTNTYFVMSPDKLSYYSDIPVVSLVTDPSNLFDKDKGIYVCGQQYLDWKNSPQYDPRKSEWDTDNVANFFSKGKEWERPASVTFFRNGECVYSQDMGVRIKGASTRNAQAKSFNLYARSEYGDSKLNYEIIDNNISYDDGKAIKKYDSFSLRAVTWLDKMRENILRQTLRDIPSLAGYDSNRCMLFIDGELWGMYDISEKSSDYFIQSNYGIPSENVAMVKNGELEEGEESDFDEIYELYKYCTKNDLSDTAKYNYVTSMVDVESLIDHYAVGLYLGTWDWPNYNYLMWKNKGDVIDGNVYSDGKWRFGSFDFDYTAGLTYANFGGVEGYAHDSFQKFGGDAKGGFPSGIFTALLKNDEFRQQFADAFCSTAYSVFEPQKMKNIIAEHNNSYMKYMTMSSWRWSGRSFGSYDNYAQEEMGYLSNEIQKMTTFFERRADYAIEDMRNYLNIHDDNTTVTVTRTGSGTITANSETVKFSDVVWTGSFKKGSTVTLTAKADEGYRFEGWSGAVTSSDETITVNTDRAQTLTAKFTKIVSPQGDINLDGEINVSDLVMYSRYILGNEEISRAQWKKADMNDDGSVDSIDLVLVRKAVIGK